MLTWMLNRKAIAKEDKDNMEDVERYINIFKFMLMREKSSYFFLSREKCQLHCA